MDERLLQRERVSRRHIDEKLLGESLRHSWRATIASSPKIDSDVARALRTIVAGRVAKQHWRHAFDDDRFRGYTTVGPHRDDVELSLEGRDARRQASQGEQRSLALALRLAGHELVRRATRRRSITPAR